MNFQNIPRDLKLIKRAFIPKRGAFSFFDYKQIEPRLLAYFASKIGDDQLASKIREGFDPYTVIVRGLYGENVTEKERQQGKVLFLSLMYGGGTRTVQAQFDVSQAEARTMIRDFHKAWPVVRRLQDLTISTASRRGHIKTPWGRHLHPEEYGEHKLLNKLIQGSAADLMKAALIRVDAHIEADPDLESRMVSVIHDELILDGPENELFRLHEDIPPLMREDWLHEIVPVEVDHEVSLTTWADKVGYDEWATSLQEAV